MSAKIDEKALELKRAYLREWRKRNKDKVRAQTERYWQRKAEKALEQEAQNG